MQKEQSKVVGSALDQSAINLTQEQLALFKTKRLGKAIFKPDLAIHEVQQIFAYSNSNFESIETQTWNLVNCDVWETRFIYMKQSECSKLIFINSYKSQKQVLNIYIVKDILFSSLKQLRIDWPHIASMQVVAQINAPILQKLKICNARNYINAKAVVKIMSFNLKYLLILSSNLFITRVNCKQFSPLSRLKFNRQTKKNLYFNAQTIVQNMGFQFKIEFGNATDPQMLYKNIYKMLKDDLLLMETFQDDKNNIIINQLRRFCKRFQTGI